MKLKCDNCPFGNVDCSPNKYNPKGYFKECIEEEWKKMDYLETKVLFAWLKSIDGKLEKIIDKLKSGEK